MKQQTLAMAADQTFENYRKPTRRDEFLKTMDAIVPWSVLCEVIEPHYPRAGNGRPPIGLERMLRIHFIQHWFNLADLACEEALFAQVGKELQVCGFKVNTGTIVNATIIGAPSSTKNADKSPNARDFTNQRTRYAGVVDEAVRTKNRSKSRIRSRVEHVFGVVKRLWGFGKVRYRGLQKNATRAFTALALANIYLGRQRLMAQVRP